MADQTSSPFANSDPSNPASRRIRFSHDDGQADEMFSPAQSPLPQGLAPPLPFPGQMQGLANPFANADAYPRGPPPHLQPPYAPPPSHSPSPPVEGYNDLAGHPAMGALPRPPPAQTQGSGFAASGVNRPGFGSPFEQPPASTPPLRFNPTTGGRFSTASQDTLVDTSAPPPANTLKPALRRSSTEEHLRLQAAREAAGMVDAHLGVPPRQPPPPFSQPPMPNSNYLAPPPRPDQPPSRERPGYDGWDEEQAETWQSEQRAAAGILSNLLRLYGENGLSAATGGMGMHRGGGSSSSRSSTGSYYGWEREQELRRRNRKNGEADEGAFPRGGGGMKRQASTWTVGTAIEDKVLDPHDPRAKNDSSSPSRGRDRDRKKKKRGDDDSSDSEREKDDTEKAKDAHKTAAKQGDELAALEAAEHRDVVEGKAAKDKKKNKYKKYKHKDAITAHVATLLQKQDFILKLAKALMTFGAPSHRLESQLNATAAVLNVNAQFIHVPSVVIASFGDSGTHTSETKFIKASGGLNLGSLHKVHEIYRDVVHDEMGVEEGVVALDRVLKSKPLYNYWQRIALAALCAGIISPMGFAGSFVDAFASGAFGGLLAFLNLFVARKNAIFSNIFEISVAALISFAARGLSTTGYFCYESVASAGVVMVLPGYVVLCGSLELASKNLIAGSVRMVYAIIYTLFLGFSIAVGSDVFYLFDPSAREQQRDPSNSVSVSGTFLGANSSMSWEGAFTFTNQTVAVVDATQASLQKGKVMCYRNPEWEWWRQGISIYWLILLVPVYSTLSSLANMQPLRSRELPVMVFIAVVGYIANRAATTYIFERSDIVSFIGATVIGLLGNLYSRVFNGTSFTAMATGVLFLVPGGIAAAGGLAMSSGESDSYNSGLMIGFRMVQVAIGITIGLFFASFLVYSVGTKRKGGGLGFAF
ncbi:hypothetical protein JCM10213_007587 [Rhodosporidiobolus nylandii]